MRLLLLVAVCAIFATGATAKSGQQRILEAIQRGQTAYVRNTEPTPEQVNKYNRLRDEMRGKEGTAKSLKLLLKDMLKHEDNLHLAEKVERCRVLLERLRMEQVERNNGFIIGLKICQHDLSEAQYHGTPQTIRQLSEKCAAMAADYSAQHKKGVRKIAKLTAMFEDVGKLMKKEERPGGAPSM